MAMSVPEVGKLIEGEASRDAIHVPVAPMEAAHDVSPGDKVGVDEAGRASRDAMPKVGVIDPYLEEDVKAGGRCWVFIFPNTISHLRHAWSHPAFGVKVAHKGANDGR